MPRIVLKNTAIRLYSAVNNARSYNLDMDRQFGFKPERPLLVFYDDLLKVYEHKACEKLMEWSANVIKADRDSKPDVDPRDGLLYTQAPLELMRMITQQVQTGVLWQGCCGRGAVVSLAN